MSCGVLSKFNAAVAICLFSLSATIVNADPTVNVNPTPESSQKTGAESAPEAAPKNKTGLIHGCRQGLTRLSQSIRWRFERMIGKVDPKGNVNQLLHPRYKNASQRKSATLNSFLAVKPAPDYVRIYNMILQSLKDPLTDKFFEADRIQEFISRQDRHVAPDGSTSVDSVMSYARYILLNRQDGLMRHAFSDELGRRGFGHFVATSTHRRVVKPLTGFVWRLATVTILVNVTQPYINTFLWPVNSKFLGGVEQAAFRFWGPLLSNNEKEEVENKANEILGRLDALAARESVLTQEEMEKEFDLAIRDWSEIFLKFKQRLRPTHASGQVMANDAQTWMDTLVLTAKVLEHRMEDLELERIRNPQMSEAERRIVDGSLERTKRELAVVVARIDWVHNTYYLFLNDVTEEALRYVDEMGRSRMIRLVGGIQEVRDIYNDVFRRTILGTTNSMGPGGP